MSQSTIILSQLEIDDCRAELFVNGAPLSRLTNSGVHLENVAAEQWLIPGSNVIEVLVEPGPTPSQARAGVNDLEFRPMSAIARLIRFSEGAKGTVETGELLGAATFDWRGGNPNRQAFPRSVTSTVELGAAHGAWLWQSAPALTLDDALIDEARAVMDELEAAIRGSHADRVWSLLELQNSELLRAFPAYTEAGLRQELTQMLSYYKAAGEVSALPRDRGAHDFRLVCGGRLVQLVDKDYDPTFRIMDTRLERVVHFPLFLGRVGKELRVLR
ncbi:MAG: hypothetical protein IPM79_29205 [Polyangiaceae bacterium]|nr:hypothetical protein [Polyangiaceae bacterium]MBK8941571.1 hypothetical protein [Polyangiaceae bacterium]